MPGFEFTPVGLVESLLDDPATAPKQGDEGSPPAWLVFDSRYADGLRGIRPGAPLLCRRSMVAASTSRV